MKKVIYSFVAIILLLLGKRLLQEDYTAFLQWWVTVFYIGIIFLPLTQLVFAGFHDKGYLFSKSIGIAIVGYLMWLFSSLHLMKFTAASIIVMVAVGLVINVFVVILGKKIRLDNTNKFNLTEILFKNKIVDAIIVEELMFFAIFLLFTYIRCFKPEAYGTEKFMDYGFMTSMMRSEYMPPQDFWFSGTKLNYYYVGQYLATFLTKLSSVKVYYGYNLMLMMVGAFTFTFSYSIGYNVILHYMKDKEKKGRFIPAVTGFVAGTAVCIAGNMHYPSYKWFEPLVRKFFGIEASTEKYWFPAATRFIGYHPETTDKTIHEFPAYSFVLGDLHAHVINIMLVLTVLGILFAWQCSRKNSSEQNPSIIKDIFHPALILIAFLLGMFYTTNYWDFPIYYVVSGAVILFTNMVVYNFKGVKIAIATASQGLLIFVASFIISLPFKWNFDQIATNLCIAVAHTPINQLIILWGLPIFMVIAFLCFVITDFVKNRKEGLSIEPKGNTPVVQHLFTSVTYSDLFIITIGLCAIGLILLPEIIYVQDIYSGDYKRANTMFKLTYQAFIMFGISFGYIFLRLICFGRTIRQRKIAITGLVLFALSVCYIQNAVNGWYGNIFNRAGYKGLDATAFMETTMPDDDLAINWLNENVEGTPVVLEAPGDSYTDYERVSVMTGLPTVLGWHTHEWLWKSDTVILDARGADIELIYTSTDETEVRQLLKKYNVSYIYVGKLEQDKYTALNHELLKSLGTVVYSNSEHETVNYETYIVQIKY